jgi:hypothetical protein
VRAGRGGGQRHLRNPLWHRTERGWASSPTAPGSTHGCARARRVERLVGTPVHARMHACAAARITRAVPTHDPSPLQRHTHRARPAAGARAPTRAPRARARTSHGPRSATRRTRVDRGGPSARPRAARALAAALPYFTPPPPRSGKKKVFPCGPPFLTHPRPISRPSVSTP